MSKSKRKSNSKLHFLYKKAPNHTFLRVQLGTYWLRYPFTANDSSRGMGFARSVADAPWQRKSNFVFLHCKPHDLRVILRGVRRAFRGSAEEPDELPNCSAPRYFHKKGTQLVQLGTKWLRGWDLNHMTFGL